MGSIHLRFPKTFDLSLVIIRRAIPVRTDQTQNRITLENEVGQTGLGIAEEGDRLLARSATDAEERSGELRARRHDALLSCAASFVSVPTDRHVVSAAVNGAKVHRLSHAAATSAHECHEAESTNDKQQDAAVDHVRSDGRRIRMAERPR